MTMTFGSLFAGIGGLDSGFEQVGMRCSWQVEIDRACQDVLRRHWPNVQKFGDVCDVGRRNLEAVDLICGGFPCQDLSVAGRRKGLAGERSGLWFEFHRVIGELKPRWIVVENVPGLLSSNGGQDFAIVLRGLVECGYGVCWRVLDAQYFGVAQRRRRVFVVASLGGGCAAEVLFEREGGAWDTPPRGKAGAKIADSITKSFAKHGGASAGKDGYPRNVIASVLAAPVKAGAPSRRNGGSYPIVGEFVVHALSAHNQRNDVDTEHFVVVGSLQAHSKRHGHAMTTQQAAESGLLVFDWQAGDGGNDQSFRGKSRSYIVRKGDYAQFRGSAHDAVFSPRFGVRRLTPTECERLQGFPDGWTEGHSDSARYRTLGNAVCVPIARWIGKRIMQVEEGLTGEE
jgi:DNA (cytosine-5)-methyltransferase 1